MREFLIGCATNASDLYLERPLPTVPRQAVHGSWALMFSRDVGDQLRPQAANRDASNSSATSKAKHDILRVIGDISRSDHKGDHGSADSLQETFNKLKRSFQSSGLPWLAQCLSQPIESDLFTVYFYHILFVQDSVQSPCAAPLQSLWQPLLRELSLTRTHFTLVSFLAPVWCDSSSTTRPMP